MKEIRRSRNDKDLPPVLDACCGARMFWFDKTDTRAIFVDKRRETFEHIRSDCGNKMIEVNPDVLASFADLPFPNDSFALVVLDPPHIVRANEYFVPGNITKYYGVLLPGWRDILRVGFSECFRVLRSQGVLILRWNETAIPLADILELTPEKPLFGHRVGRREQTHWLCFLKN